MIKKIFLLIILLIVAFYYISYPEWFQYVIRRILEWNKLNIVIWCFVTICFLMRWYSVKDIQGYDSGLIYKDFGVFADNAFAAITYGLTLTTSTAILKGVYIQLFFKEAIYFKDLDNIDIYSMLVVCIYLLSYSMIASFKSIIETFRTSQSMEAVSG